MKYNKHHIKKIIESLQNGDGRVRACKNAGITHETFMNWLEKYSDFYDLIKKAEDVGLDKIKDLAKRGIIEKFQTTWQAAAWWLERNYPEEFGAKRESLDLNLSIDSLQDIVKKVHERRAARNKE